MKKRFLSILMIITMIANMIPISAFAAENKGDGTKENPYQVGDMVVSEEEPEGYIVENSYWEKTEVAAQYGDTAICGEEHVHSLEANCYELTCTTNHGHSTESGCVSVLNCTDPHHTDSCYGMICNEVHEHIADTCYAPTCTEAHHTDSCYGLTCTAAHHTDSCYTTSCNNAHHSMSNGCYTQKCSNTHKHSVEAGCYPVVQDAYTVWTLTASELTENMVMAAEANEDGEEASETGDSDEEEPPTYSVKVTAAINNSSTVPSGATLVINGPLEDGGGDDNSSTYNTTIGADGTATVEGLKAGKYVAVVTYTSTDRNSKDYYGSQVFYVTSADVAISVTMSSSAINWSEATDKYNKTSYFNHVDIRVSGSYTESEDDILSNYNIKLQNASVTVTNNGSYGDISVAHSDNSETYEWRKTNVKIAKSAVITLVCDIYDTSGNLLKEDFTVVFSGEVAFKQAIINCDNNEGLDFIINPITIVQAVTYQVDYEWEVIGDDAATAAALTNALNAIDSPPDTTEGYKSGSTHTVDTVWPANLEKIVTIEGASGEEEYYLIKFQGWTEYSNATDKSVATSNGSQIKITSDTTVYGYWTYQKLEQTEGYLTITKTIQIPTGYESRLSLEDMWFSVTEGTETIGVSFSQMTRIESTDGTNTTIKLTYTLPIITEGTIIVEEKDVDLSGFTRTSTSKVTPKQYTLEVNNELTTIDLITVESKTDEKVVGSVTLPHIQTISLDEGTYLGSIDFTNTYTKNTGSDVHEYPDLIIRKLNKDTYELLEGVEFTLTGKDGEAKDVVKKATTNAYGIIDFKDLLPGTYTLKETKKLDGYDINNTEYTVTVALKDSEETLIDGNWVTTHTYEVTVEGLDIHYNYYVIYNQKIEGDLTIKKDFGVNNAYTPESIKVKVTGPNGYENVVTLSEGNEWTTKLTGLSFGEYTIIEDEAEAAEDGYELFVDDNEQKVTLNGKNDNATVTITNTYSKIEVNPAGFKVYKVDENGDPLENVTFTLYSDSAYKNVVANKTTDSTGYAVFEGFNQAATYYLKETATPEYYNGIDTVWTVTVSLEDGEVKVAVDEETGIMKSIYNWIAGINPDDAWKEGVLTVENTKKTGSLTITKTVEYLLDGKAIDGSLDGRDDTAYSFKVEFSDDTLNETFTLKDGETKTIEGIPYGTEYTVTEETTGAVYVSTITGGTGIIKAEETKTEVVNTYDYVTYNNGLNLVKVDDETGKPIEGAGFTLYEDAALTKAVAETTSNANGELSFEIPAAGTYYLVETTTPEGYYSNNSVYTVTAALQYEEGADDNGNPVIYEIMVIKAEKLDGTTTNNIDYIYTIENTLIKKHSVNVEKIWDDADYKGRPEQIEVTLYKDGEAYDTVALSAENNWKYEWADLSEEYTWTVDEVNVPTGYEKTVDQEGYKFTITNERIVGDLTITKAFGVNNAYTPESITVHVTGPDNYKKAFVLTAANNWTATLKGLAFGEYTVTEDEEAAAADGYELFVADNVQKVTLNGTNNDVEVMITNTYSEVNVIPASVTVYKVDESGEPLEGVTFTLYSDKALTKEVTSKTTDTDGLAVFSGFNEASTYYLKETATPEYYNGIDTVWTVTVSLENGEANVAVDEETGIMKSIYNWIAGINPDDAWKEGVLTVENTKKTGSLTITKTVEYFLDGKAIDGSLDGRDDTAYSFKVEFSDDTLNETFTLKDGETKTIEGIPYGTEYTVTEETTGAVYVSTITGGTGIIEAAKAETEVVNTYDYVTYNNGLNLVKVDDETGKPIAGAGFTLYKDAALTQVVAKATSNANGELNLQIAEAGTYYLAETTTPEGYYNNDAVYIITAELQYEEGRDAEGNLVIFEQMVIRAGLKGTAVNAIDYIYTVENTAIKKVDISVEKVWDDGNSKNRPNSIEVTLYKDGKAYETVKLNAANKWNYTWKDLSEEFKWTVDEKDVPDGYTKTVKQDGYKFTITNKYTKTTQTTPTTPTTTPKTGDYTDVGTWTMISLLALAAVGAAVMKLRRKEEE